MKGKTKNKKKNSDYRTTTIIIATSSSARAATAIAIGGRVECLLPNRQAQPDWVQKTFILRYEEKFFCAAAVSPLAAAIWH